ncbi:hypothetical protein EYC59_00825 [Candidatus Saccharibacteria bacterium]|nr:MAG: hypothetical protein EYC59_00825 [Candidatus Saccharibacteria bacterium]
MIPALKSEFRKIFTVRSTWVILALATAFGSVLIGFWIFGYKDVADAKTHADALLASVLTAAGVSGVILSFIMLLLVGHEYRYSTIMYSLTSSASRSRVFFAKLLAGSAIVLLFGMIVVALNFALFALGQNLNPEANMAQQIAFGDVAWRLAVSFIGSALFAFAIAMLLRNQIASIAVILLMPATVEGLLGLLLKDNVKYLPFTALGNITASSPKPEPLFSLVVVGVYAVVLGVLSWLLFVRRDAN